MSDRGCSPLLTRLGAAALLAATASLWVACSSSETHGGGSGGAPPSGGFTGAGGSAPASGGISVPSGGSRDTPTGGSPATGGASTGGVPTSGGAKATGGAAANPSGAGGAGAPGAGAASGGGGSAAVPLGGAATTAGAAGASGGGAARSAGCGATEPLKSGRATLDVAGASREFILKMPDDYDASRPYKLIFAFHARGGSAMQVAGSGNDDYYGLVSRSGGNAIFVSPEGIDAGWRNENGRDITFVKAMLELFESKLCIDQQRIFSTGFSFGGMMSDAIGCAMADVFRAIAPMAGGVPNPEHPYSGCDQVNMHPIAVWMSHGDNDNVVPISDGKDALEIFLKRNQCQAETAPVMPSPCVAYQGCLPDYPVTFCEFSGGHGVPSFAAEAIWAFFDQF